ncbi:MAG: hypothetical protein RLZZ431_417 [Bacteroidota bacterium]
MERRNFLKQNVLVGGSLLAGSSLLAANAKAIASNTVEPTPLCLKILPDLILLIK